MNTTTQTRNDGFLHEGFNRKKALNVFQTTRDAFLAEVQKAAKHQCEPTTERTQHCLQKQPKPRRAQN